MEGHLLTMQKVKRVLYRYFPENLRLWSRVVQVVLYVELYSDKYNIWWFLYFDNFCNISSGFCSQLHVQNGTRHWIYIYIYIYTHTHTHRVSQEEWARLRESVPYVKVYWYNPKHPYPKLNGYGDNGQRKVRSSCGSKYCTCSADALSTWGST